MVKKDSATGNKKKSAGDENNNGASGIEDNIADMLVNVDK